MLTRKNKLLLLKLLSLFSVVRGYNILMIVLAQYLASIYILSPDLPLRKVIFDVNLFFIVVAAGGARQPLNGLLPQMLPMLRLGSGQ